MSQVIWETEKAIGLLEQFSQSLQWRVMLTEHQDTVFRANQPDHFQVRKGGNSRSGASSTAKLFAGSLARVISTNLPHIESSWLNNLFPVDKVMYYKNLLQSEGAPMTVSKAHLTQEIAEDFRELSRHHLAVAANIYESKCSEVRGMISNVTEKGIAITGLRCAISQTKTLVIPAGDFFEADMITFEAGRR